MVTLQEWDWVPNNMTFQPQLRVHEPRYGKKPHGHGSPYWMFSMQLPIVDETTRREIDIFRATSGGVSVVEFYDVRCPYPVHYEDVDPALMEATVPDVTIIAMVKADSTLVVQGSAGDVITKGDPISFVYGNVRYYFKFTETVALNGTHQTIGVINRPRTTINPVSVVADRIMPRCRFVCDFNNMGGHTEAHGFTSFTLSGIEYFGEVS